MKEHRLKTWPQWFGDVVDEIKTFEFRKNDRGFKEGDYLILEEWNPETKTYTGNVCKVRVDYILQECPGLPEGYCIMGIERSN